MSTSIHERRRRGIYKDGDPIARPPDPAYQARLSPKPTGQIICCDNFRPAPRSITPILVKALAAYDASRPQRGALAPIDDGWWADVLLDPRAKAQDDATDFEPDNINANLRLDRQPGKTLTVCCACGLGKTFSIAELIDGFGGSTNVAWLARKLIDCGHRNKVANYCRAYVVR